MAHIARRVSPERLRFLLGGWADGRGPLFQLLANRLEAIITAGLLDNGDRLPSERQLAASLSVARGTIVRAYDELAVRGRAVRTRGSGTHVTSASASARPRVERATTRLVEPTWMLDLRVARPSLLDSVRHLADRAVLGQASIDERDAGDPAGLPALRAATADLMSRDGLETAPEEILITTGAQHGATLVALHLLERGGRVAVESVTWPGFPDVVEHLGGRVERIPLGPDGVDLGAVGVLCERIHLSFVALNPHHHNPTGTRLDDSRRSELVRIIGDANVPLVEDRVLARLAFDGRVPPPLAATPPARNRQPLHITLDSLNKVAWSGLRMGWIRATASTIQQLRTVRAMTDFAPAVQPQLAALAILDDLESIVDQRVEQLRARCDEMFDALPAAIPEAVAPRPRGGIVVWIRLPRGTGHDFSRHAAARGISVPSGTDFGAPPDDPHIRLPLTITRSELDTAMTRLAGAWTTFG